jgi:hypothetical protein
VKPHGSGDWYFVVDKGTQKVLHATAADGYVNINDLRGTNDPTFDVDGGRSGPCINAMKDDVAVETVYGAVN